MARPGTSRSQQRGRDAERYAANYLCQRGYQIVETNVRFRVGEIDIVAEEDGVLVFVEVRARRSGAFGAAGESIGPGKRRRTYQAAEAYLQAHPDAAQRPSRIDVVAIELGRRGEPIGVELIRSAVEPS